MNRELLQLAADLTTRGESFVVAIVVRREPFSSAHQGDMAIVTADGAYHGWLGGSCVRPTVEREAARVLADGKARLISLAPEPDPPRSGITQLPMTCHSGGTLEIFIEPVLAAPRLLVFGGSPIAQALGRLGKAMGYHVDVVDPEAAETTRAYADRVLVDFAAPELRTLGSAASPVSAVVATMGDADEDAVGAALALRPAYLGVVASRKRFASMRETLLARGATAAQIDAIKNPAGLDIGGRVPEEVALSILAEIVQLRRAAETRGETRGETLGETLGETRGETRGEPRPLVAVPAVEEAIDPVCSMKVKIAGARHVGEWAGQRWYFCNPRCKDKFLADPHRYLGAPEGGASSPEAVR